MQQQHDRQQKRTAQAQRNRADVNQSKLILDRQQQQSQQAQGRFRQQQQQAKQQWQTEIHDAKTALPAHAERLWLLLQSQVAAGKRVLETHNLHLPYAAVCTVADVRLCGPGRIHVCGGNGSGKSTLLRVLAGLQAPLRGRVEVAVLVAYIDQKASLLDDGADVLTQLRRHHTRLPEALLRQYLHLLGLGSAHIRRPCGLLSGGERVKAALALALWRQEPAQLLLLDEPNNHLDLPSMRALERALAEFDGAIMVASHDADFVQALRLDAQWRVDNGIWQLAAV